MSQKVIALCDCHAFYCSVETNSLFRPDLVGKTVVVASNGDGCVVARNPAAKRLGIKMGEPLFKIKDLIRDNEVEVFSSQYTNYANMSARVMAILGTFTPVMAVYSIDESFLDLTGINVNLTKYGQQIQKAVLTQTGLGIGVGISVNTTMAKAASWAGKTYKATGGVVDLTSPERQGKLLAIMPVGEVWGVGQRISKRLQSMGINTAADLAAADTRLIRDQFSVVLERTVRELRGEQVIPLELAPPQQKQIVHSRSFGRPVENLTEMREAVHSYAFKAVEKMRKKSLSVRVITVFIQTSPFKPEEYYYNSAIAPLPIATSDTRSILAASSSALNSIWREGKRYIRAGVMLLDLQPSDVEQLDLISRVDERGTNLMRVMDEINAKGKTTIYFASQGIGKRKWEMKRQRLSPYYLTRWSDIPIVS